MSGKKDILIAHILPDTGPHLNRVISKLILSKFHSVRIYLREEYKVVDTKLGISDNKDWVCQLPTGVFGGVLIFNKCIVNNKLNRYIKRVLSLMLPEFDASSLLSVVFGPRYWVVHGRALSFPTIFLMRLLGKKVVFINWGNHLCVPKIKTAFAYKWQYKLLSKCYVLMTPEMNSYAEVVGRNKVCILPYPTDIYDNRTKQSFLPTVDISNGEIIIGNSGFVSHTYPEILEKIPSGSWKRIICMLNYGCEGEERDGRLKKYRTKFGDGLYEWNETLPRDEYEKFVSSPLCYVGPQERQSGLGAIFLSVLSGRVVILRGDNYAWLKEIGISVLNIDDINDWSYESIKKLVPSLAEYRRNIECLIHHFSVKYSMDVWKRTLYRDLLS